MGTEPARATLHGNSPASLPRSRRPIERPASNLTATSTDGLPATGPHPASSGPSHSRTAGPRHSMHWAQGSAPRVGALAGSTDAASDRTSYWTSGRSPTHSEAPQSNLPTRGALPQVPAKHDPEQLQGRHSTAIGGGATGGRAQQLQRKAVSTSAASMHMNRLQAATHVRRGRRSLTIVHVGHPTDMPGRVGGAGAARSFLTCRDLPSSQALCKARALLTSAYRPHVPQTVEPKAAAAVMAACRRLGCSHVHSTGPARSTHPSIPPTNSIPSIPIGARLQPITPLTRQKQRGLP